MFHIIILTFHTMNGRIILKLLQNNLIICSTSVSISLASLTHVQIILVLINNTQLLIILEFKRGLPKILWQS